MFPMLATTLQDKHHHSHFTGLRDKYPAEVRVLAEIKESIKAGLKTDSTPHNRALSMPGVAICRYDSLSQ